MKTNLRHLEQAGLDSEYGWQELVIDDAREEISFYRALLAEAPVVEIVHLAPKRYYQGETETDMLHEYACFLDPIETARRVPDGKYRLVPAEEGEHHG